MDESRAKPVEQKSAPDNPRHCYCGMWETNPAFMREKNYQPGFCGICERCGKPGHTRHFPGPVPYTCSWCDRCYRIVPWTNPVTLVRRLVFLGIGAMVLWTIIRLANR